MMRARRLKSLVMSGAALAMIMPTGAHAWGPDGHEIIWTVALARLQRDNPQLAALAEEILRPKDTQPFTRDYVDDNGQRHHCVLGSARDIANWPDCVRDDTADPTAGFHYDDVPLCGIPPRRMPPIPPYCDHPAGNCATQALDRYIAALRTSQDPQVRAEALAWIIHIVGDLHQPLHAEDNNNDRGGNLVLVRADQGALPFSAAPNLHSFWDGTMVRAAVGRTAQAVPVIENLADQNATRWGQTDPFVWLGESHAIARQAYRQLTPAVVCNAGRVRGERITRAYVTRFTVPVREQLAKAAVRLALVLRSALS